MILKFIKETTCPDCGCKDIYSEKTLRHDPHSSGKWAETRTFVCGKAFSFSPNFNKVIEKGTCIRCKFYINERKRRSIALTKIRGLVSDLKVDEEFKEKLYLMIADIGSCFYISENI